MKKLIFLVAVLVVMATCMVACSTQNADNGVDIPVIPTTEEVVVPELPELSGTFIETALQFIDEYPASSKKLENLAAEVIPLSMDFRGELYAYLNSYIVQEHGEEILQLYGYGNNKIHTVKVWIHNYELGGNVGCAAFNGQEPFYNYEHDKLILAAGVVGEKYPDNVTLAEARIASFILTQMSQDDVEDACITTTAEGKSYDFTFENEAFKETAKEILQDLCEG